MYQYSNIAINRRLVLTGSGALAARYSWTGNSTTEKPAFSAFLEPSSGTDGLRQVISCRAHRGDTPQAESPLRRMEPRIVR